MFTISFPEWASAASWLILRVGYGLLFLNAAWACGKDAAARQWTIDETSIVFPRHTNFFAYSGIAIMGLGGASILSGLASQWGGLALFFFLIPGAWIHFRQMGRADALTETIKGKLMSPTPELGTLQVSAKLGHYSSALKNLTLATGALFFGIHGSGPLSLSSLF
jgi:uncharacterized membrane protein YphA (DoxX/SURF4 family)